VDGFAVLLFLLIKHVLHYEQSDKGCDPKIFSLEGPFLRSPGDFFKCTLPVPLFGQPVAVNTIKWQTHRT